MHYSFPFQTTLTLSLILIFLSSCNTQSPTYPPYEISENSITIKSYSSNLTNEQRQEYKYWIGIRNSFYYSKDDNKYAKVIKYFTPEDSNYYPKIYFFSYPFYIIATLIGALILYYLVKELIKCKQIQNENILQTEKNTQVEEKNEPAVIIKKDNRPKWIPSALLIITGAYLLLEWVATLLVGLGII